VTDSDTKAPETPACQVNIEAALARSIAKAREAGAEPLPPRRRWEKASRLEPYGRLTAGLRKVAADAPRPSWYLGEAVVSRVRTTRRRSVTLIGGGAAAVAVAAGVVVGVLLWEPFGGRNPVAVVAEPVLPKWATPDRPQRPKAHWAESDGSTPQTLPAPEGPTADRQAQPPDTAGNPIQPQPDADGIDAGFRPPSQASSPAPGGTAAPSGNPSAPPPRGLRVAAARDRVTVERGSAVTLDVTWSDGDGRLAAVFANWGGGYEVTPHATGQCGRGPHQDFGTEAVSHTFDTAGTYQVLVGARTTGCTTGWESKATVVTVVVTEPSPPPSEGPTTEPTTEPSEQSG
jgi:hypothetical protein